MIERIKRRLRAATGLCVAAIPLVAFFSIDERSFAADFYAGKQIRLVVGSGAGGGLDVYARALAPHFAAHLPGSPSVVVEDMPGAIGIAALNWLARSAPRDGLAIVASSNVAMAAPLFGSKGAQYDPRTFGAIGSISRQVSVCVTWESSSVRTIADARNKEVLVGADAAASRSATIPQLMNEMIGTKFKVVTGYATTDIGLALERGEIEGLCGLSWSTLKAAHPDWIQNKKLHVLIQTGESPQKDLPDVPTLASFATDKSDSDLLKILAFPDDVGRPYVTAPDVPGERLAELRHAFDATMTDPAYLADAMKASLDVDPLSGVDMAKLISSAYASPPALAARAAKYGGAAN